MDKLARKDLLPLDVYEQVRSDWRQGIIEYKRNRRVQVGDRITLVFENRKTMRWQVMEMLRAEHIKDPGAIDAELEVYNALVPGDGELIATMYIAFSETDRVREEMPRFLGTDQSVWLVAGDHAVHAEPEAGHSKEDRISAVQYLFFHLDAAAAKALATPGTEVRLEVRHEHAAARQVLTEQTRASLAEDLAGGPKAGPAPRS